MSNSVKALDILAILLLATTAGFLWAKDWREFENPRCYTSANAADIMWPYVLGAIIAGISLNVAGFINELTTLRINSVYPTPVIATRQISYSQRSHWQPGSSFMTAANQRLAIDRNASIPGSASASMNPPILNNITQLIAR